MATKQKVVCVQISTDEVYASSTADFLYSHPQSNQRYLTDNENLLRREVVLGNLEVQRGGTLAYTAGDIVVRTVAGAEPAAKVAGLADGDTTEVSADA